MESVGRLPTKSEIDKALFGLPRCDVSFASGFLQLKFHPEFCAHRDFVIPHHVEAAAFGGTIGSESGENNRPAGLEGFPQSGKVGAPVKRIGEEMKDGAVMPQTKTMWRIE